MKIVFLDIDGVLNCSDESKKQFINCTFDEMEASFFLNKELIENLNYVTDYTGAGIVVSSSWRLMYSYDELKEILICAGITGELIDSTPHFGFSDWIVRGNEISNWLEQSLEPIENYVILDDDSDMLLSQKDNFVHINDVEGFSKKYVWKTIEILNRGD